MLERLAAALDGSGPAILPLEAGLPPERLARILDAFAPSAVETPDGLSRQPQRARGIPVSEQAAVVIATSGSTGQPKGVELSASALTHSARASLARVGAVPGDRWLLCLPATHIAGIQVLVRSLVAGTEPVIAGRWTRRSWKTPAAPTSPSSRPSYGACSPARARGPAGRDAGTHAGRRHLGR